MAEKITLARPYATAIFDLAVEEGSLDDWSSKLQLLSEITSVEEVLDLIGNPDISLDNRVSIIGELCNDQLDKQLDDELKNLLLLAGENGRLSLFPQIAGEFEKLKSNAQGSIEAEVISAFGINVSQKKLIIESLKKRFDKDVSVTTSIDESLLGGIIIRVGDLVIDGSISNQLQKITHTLTR